MPSAEVPSPSDSSLQLRGETQKPGTCCRPSSVSPPTSAVLSSTARMQDIVVSPVVVLFHDEPVHWRTSWLVIAKMLAALVPLMSVSAWVVFVGRTCQWLPLRNTAVPFVPTAQML